MACSASPRAELSLLALAIVAAAPACRDADRIAEPLAVAAELECDIPRSQIFDGGPGKDGIPALTSPRLVGVGERGTEYLRDEDRVIGLLFGGQAIAVPLNIGWWHEIVNLDVGVTRVAVTHCPLTGSSLTFDRGEAGGSELGVSGLLYMNNLIMYDRSRSESLWPQMLRGAACGPGRGRSLAMLPSLEMTWLGWRTLHPGTRVVSAETGFPRNYRAYPYGDYAEPSNPITLFPMPSSDSRRPPKERVLGIPDGARGGIAFAFGSLDEAGPFRAVHRTVGGKDVVVFWDRARQAAAAFLPAAAGRRLTFSANGEALVDSETGSTWMVDGSATAGALAGQRLEPLATAYVAYWFAWAGFHPSAELWTGTP